jgi:hypothetical protein
MAVIPHDDVTGQSSVVADNRVLQSVDQPPSVRVIANDFLTAIAPHHHVVDGALNLDPQSPRHVRGFRTVGMSAKPNN